MFLIFGLNQNSPILVIYILTNSYYGYNLSYLHSHKQLLWLQSYLSTFSQTVTMVTILVIYILTNSYYGNNLSYLHSHKQLLW